MYTVGQRGTGSAIHEVVNDSLGMGDDHFQNYLWRNVEALSFSTVCLEDEWQHIKRCLLFRNFPSKTLADLRGKKKEANMDSRRTLLILLCPCLTRASFFTLPLSPSLPHSPFSPPPPLPLPHNPTPPSSPPPQSPPPSHLSELHICRVSKDAPIVLLVTSIANQLNIPYTKVIVLLYSRLKHSDGRPGYTW